VTPRRTRRAELALVALLAALSAPLGGDGQWLWAQQPAGARAATPAARVVTGRVTSRGDGAPVAGAEVVHRPSGARVRTDAYGAFRMAAERGDTLDVRALGFRSRSTVVTAEPMTIVLETVATVLPGFITTVGQRAIRASESARQLLIADRRAIDASAAISANQLLRQLPGLQELPTPPARTTIAMRGFDDARVLVLVDGEPVPGGLVESRDIGRASTVGVERIEVTKGPGSVEFGSDAIGGVINIVRAAPSVPFTSTWLVRQGGLGRREATGEISQTRGALGYRVDGGWRQVDRVTGYDAATATFQRVYDLRTDLRYALGARWGLRLSAQGTQERQRFPVDARFNGFIDNRAGSGFLEATGPVAGGQLRVRASGIRFAYQYRQARGLLPIRGSADSLEQRERQERLLLAWTRQVGGHAVDLGMQHSWRSLTAPGRLTGNQAADLVREAFARDAWTLGDWQLSAGGRYTSSSLWGEAWTPSLGALWQPASAWRMRGSLARGFRAPGFKEIRYTFFNPAGGYQIVGNPDLRPESSVSGSVGGTWAPSLRWSLDAEAYRNDVKDLVDWSYRGDNAAGYQTYANVNIARARTQGIETNVRVMLAGTEVTAGYDFLKARNLSTGLPLTRRATHTARLRASREWALLEGLQGDVSVRYTGNAPLIGIPAGAPITGPFSTEPGIVGRQGALLSVDMQWRLRVSKLATLSFGGNNLLNQQPALWTPAFQRQMYAGLSIHWAAVEK